MAFLVGAGSSSPRPHASVVGAAAALVHGRVASGIQQGAGAGFGGGGTWSSRSAASIASPKLYGATAR
mgnify:CR=1 FL=1